jgi:hypothetical protein
MSRDPSDDDTELTTAEAIVDAIGQSFELPVDALRRAAEHRDTVAPRLIAEIERAQQPLSDLTDAHCQRILLGTGLLAEWGDTRAYEPLTQLLIRVPWAADACFGDGVTEVLPQYLVSLARGQDLSPLAIIAQLRDADEFLRTAGLDAWFYEAWSRGLPELELRHWVDVFYESAEKALDGYFAQRWAELILTIGLDGYESSIRAVLEAANASSLPLLTRAELDEIERLRTEEGVDAAFAAGNIAPFQDTIATFSHWYGFTPAGAEERRRELRAAAQDRRVDPSLPEPARNPHRHVGRNDPCPCGSGKKFKKCCAA